MKQKSKSPELRRESRKEFAQVTARTRAQYQHYLRMYENVIDQADTILDVCGGASSFAEEVNSACGFNKVTVVDAKANELGLNPEYSHQGLAEDLDFDDDTFDHSVMMWGTVYMTREESVAAFREMVRVTKPGGSVRIHGVGATKMDIGRSEYMKSIGASKIHMQIPISEYGGSVPADAFLHYLKPETPEDGFEEAVDIIYEKDLLRPGGKIHRATLFAYGALQTARRKHGR